MPTTVTVHEAKTTLSDLLRRVEAGEEIIIARGETPVAILRAHKSEDVAAKRKAAFGCLAGRFAVPDEDTFFASQDDAEFAEMFGEDFLTLHTGKKLSPPAPTKAGKRSGKGRT
jgi:antitoxin (DNA-binding transcriptional repressor) of toxin-antitoxin stability system